MISTVGLPPVQRVHFSRLDCFLRLDTAALVAGSLKHLAKS